MSYKEEMHRFNTIKTRYLVKAMKYADNKYFLSDVTGDLLEHLVALALHYLKYNIKRKKTKGIDLLVEKRPD